MPELGTLALILFQILVTSICQLPRTFFPITLVRFLLLSVFISQQIQGIYPGNAKFPVIKCIAREREALLSLKHSFVDNYGILSSWRSDDTHKECCKWDRVRCSNQTGHVEKLDLQGTSNSSLQLQGMISPSLKQLTHLQYLDLSFTDFLVNHIPKSISTLTNLTYLNLSYCYLGGKIPHEFGNLVHLQYLDLQSNLLDGEIPAQISKLSSLAYLDLTFNDFSGTIPDQLGNLSSLQNLSLGPFSWDLSSNLEWVSHLSSSMRVLRMEDVDLSSAINWPKLIAGLLHLQVLHLTDCSLPNSVPFSVSDMNLSKSLTEIDLSSNNLTSSIFPWLINFHSSLAVLRLTENYLQGSIPKSLTNLSSLQELWLGSNQLEEGMPISLWDLCTLSVVRLNNNYLRGLVFEFLPTFSHCAKNSLRILDLGWNEQITGNFPNLSHLSSMQELYVDGNQINGTFTESVGHLSNLEVLSAYGNSLKGIITEAHFFNLSKLRDLDLTSNALSFKVSADWIPPFQLNYVYLEGCNLGPGMPSWLQTQKSIVWLDISNTGIADTVPQWLWNMSLPMQNTNFSHNQLTGVIPNLPIEYEGFPQIDLSSNLFQGPIPSFLSTARSLYLSNNNFTDLTLLLCTTKLSYLFLLDLSNNKISELPDCWMNFKALSFLNLANNNLYGEIPTSMGLLVQIQAIHLRNNHLSEELPIALGNCTELRILDVGRNNLTGQIPKWVGGKLKKLLVLIMQSNNFYGSLPSSMCALAHIQILDLSLNRITGSIPSCVNNFTALASGANENATIGYSYNSADGATYVQFDSALVTWKGKESEYKSTLGLVRSIDFSGNKLVGEIPQEITQLVELISLNLSRNRLSGKIPSDIGNLKLLDALDLSRNFLSGKIPSSLAKIDRIGVLDLSYNNLSGRIPMGTQIQTFNETCFAGNPQLCGPPLPKSCPDDQTKSNEGNANEDESIWDHGFYISLVLGFVAASCGVCCMLALNRSWRLSYFKFMNNAYEKLASITINMEIVRGKLMEFKEQCLRRQERHTREVAVVGFASSKSQAEGIPTNIEFWSSLYGHNNYNNAKSSDECGHSGKNWDLIQASSDSTPSGHCLDSGISSNLSAKAPHQETDEIVEDTSGCKHGSDSKAPIT